MRQYLDLLRHVREHGARKEDRTGTGTLAVFGWLVFDLVAGELALRLARPIGSLAAWYAAYLVAGWLAAAVAAVLLGRRVQEEGRTV